MLLRLGIYMMIVPLSILVTKTMEREIGSCWTWIFMIGLVLVINTFNNYKKIK